MARARNLKPGFFLNDELAECDPLARLLFAGLWCIADREGRLEDRPKRIKAEILPYDDCDVDKFLNDLQSHGFIKRYEVDGKRYIQIINFKKHQNPHIKEAASIIPPPPEDEPAPEKHHTCTVQEPEKHTENPADSLVPCTDSLKPSTESISSSSSKVHSTVQGTPEAKVEATANDDDDDDENPYTFYENNFGTLSPITIEKIKELEDNIGPRMVIEAMKIAVLNRARGMRYVETIIRDWLDHNIRDPSQLEAYERTRKNKSSPAELENKTKEISERDIAAAATYIEIELNEFRKKKPTGEQLRKFLNSSKFSYPDEVKHKAFERLGISKYLEGG